MTTPALPKGTRDFSPEEVYKRQYIFNTIRSVFEMYGYRPIETPVMELSTTLTGKYGDEGDKLLFRVLDSGDFLADAKRKLPPDQWEARTLLPHISEKGLKYDLTVPFARYVVMHRNDIVLPFKRYQIQPVFRADKPQKGRYREFYQCDADVVGSASLQNEAEFVMMYDRVFQLLNLKVVIKVNNRKVLNGLAEVINASDKFIAMTVAIDKLDKLGMEGVKQELSKAGFEAGQVETIERAFMIQGSNGERIEKLRSIIGETEIGRRGCDELSELFEKLSVAKLENRIEIDNTLARGLNYYTGTIIEVVAGEGTLKSSIGGGGRYDDLTGGFGWQGLTGVGISFGADRIYDVLDELKKFPSTVSESTQILFINFGGADADYAWQVVNQLRDEGIRVELYPDAVKVAKQFKYADARKIPFTGIIGETERTQNKINVKDMASGEQKLLSASELITFLQTK